MTLERTLAAIEDGQVKKLHVGAQLMATVDGVPVADLALGEARPGVPMRSDSLVPWFSCTKALTATAVAQQWERGAIDLDAPVARYVAEFGANGKESVTVRHVLTHTGGFRTAGPGPGGAFRSSFEEMLQEICAAPLEPGWAPGQRAGYHAQAGFHVLGAVVNRVSGRHFCDYVTEEVIEPCDMADSWMRLPVRRAEAYGDRLAVMHDTSGDEPRPAKRFDRADVFDRCLPSGGAVGPAADLVKLFEMFLGGGERGGVRVLQPETVREMIRRHRTGMKDETFGSVIDWGLGLMINSWQYKKRPAWYGYGDHASRDAFGHGGSQSSVAFADPVHRLAAAVVFNGMPGEVANHARTQPVITALYEDLGLAASQRS